MDRLFLLLVLRPTRATRTDKLFPCTTLFRSTPRNRMPRLRQARLPASAGGAALAQASATSIRMSDTDAGNARHAATTLRRGHADACTRFMAGAPHKAGGEIGRAHV